MSQPSPFSERLRKAFGPNSQGVVGVVDELPALCRESSLQFGWHDGVCHVQPLGAPEQEAIHVPLPKSVFRAMLARIAALCNERTPDSISPYGGEADLFAETNPPAVFHVAFTNTPDEQRLEVRYVGDQSEKVAFPSAPLNVLDPAHVASPGST